MHESSQPGYSFTHRLQDLRTQLRRTAVTKSPHTAPPTLRGYRGGEDDQRKFLLFFLMALWEQPFV